MAKRIEELERDIGTLLGRLGVEGAERLATAVLRGTDEVSIPSEQSLALLLCDAVEIQELVLASRSPTTTRGASRVLAGWDQRAETWASSNDHVLLFSGGGLSVLLGPAAGHEERTAELERLFARETQGEARAVARVVSPRALIHGPAPMTGRSATEVAALEKLGVDSGGGGGFGALLGECAAALALRKDQPRPAKARPAPQRCEECGERGGIPREQSVLRCDRCDSFRQGGRRDRGKDPRTFDELPGGPAYIAIDGKGVGKTLQSLRTLGDYAVLSTTLHRMFGAVGVEEALRAIGVEPDSVWRVISGGDDVLLVVGAGARGPDWSGPVELAEKLAHRAVKQGQETRDALRRTIGGAQVPVPGLGVGVAVARNLPARLGFNLAKEMVASAKRRVGDDALAAIDFEYFPGSSLVSGSIMGLRTRKVRPFKPPGTPREGSFRLYRKPYTLAELCELREVGGRLEGEKLGRSALYHARQALDEDPVAGVVTVAYTLARAGVDAAGIYLSPGAPWAGLDTLLVRDERALGLAEQAEWSSALPDLVDLLATRRIEGGRT